MEWIRFSVNSERQRSILSLKKRAKLTFEAKTVVAYMSRKSRNIKYRHDLDSNRFKIKFSRYLKFI